MRQFKLLSFFLLVLLVSLNSCLKESPMNIDTSKGPKNILEFENTGDDLSTGNSTYPDFYSDLGVVALGASSKFNVNVSYAGVDQAPEDITVNLAVDPAVLTQYNTENG